MGAAKRSVLSALPCYLGGRRDAFEIDERGWVRLAGLRIATLRGVNVMEGWRPQFGRPAARRLNSADGSRSVGLPVLGR
jgi:hypothetical protein